MGEVGGKRPVRGTRASRSARAFAVICCAALCCGAATEASAWGAPAGAEAQQQTKRMHQAEQVQHARQAQRVQQQVQPYARKKPRTERVSVGADGAQLPGSSGQPSISANGRYVAFMTNARIPGRGTEDVLVRDLRTGKVTQVDPVDEEGRKVGAVSPEISANGRYVVYSSYEYYYPRPGRPPVRRSDVFVHDLRTGRTEQADVGLEAGHGGQALDPSISADGRYVAFAAGEEGGDLYYDWRTRIYVRDRETGTSVRLTGRPSTGVSGSERYPRMSRDGRVVAYTLYSNQVSGRGWKEAYAADRKTGVTHRLDVPYDGSTPQREGAAGDIHPNGRYVLFTSRTGNILPDRPSGGLFLRDLRTGTTRSIEGDLPGSYATSAMFNSTGSHLTFEAPELRGSYVRDLRTGRTLRVDVRDDGGPGGARSEAGAADARGKTVAFPSYAADLVPDDTNDSSDVFARHLR